MAALYDQAFIQHVAPARIQQGIAYLSEQFDRLGLVYFPTAANFIMVDVARPAKEVYEGLLRKGYYSSAAATILACRHYMRVTVGSREQNEKFIAALEQVLQEVPAAVIAK